MGNYFRDCIGVNKTEPFTCIQEIGNNYPDLSYNKLKNEINQSIITIIKNEGNKGFPSDRILNLEYELFVNYIDYDEEHSKNLEEGFNELCRYSDIKTYKYNTVKINTEKKFINASPINIFNKNYYFISTQGPTDKTIEDFWTMIEQYKCNIIIMLCKLEELGRPKCAFYWNDKNEMKKYKIDLLSEEKVEINSSNHIMLRKIKLTNNDSKEEKEVTQLHYEEWPDHGVPDINQTFELFEYMIKKVDELKGDAPGVVHCSAGVGRTGTFISIYSLYKEITDQISNDKLYEIKFSIFNFVRKLKEMRLFMVQTAEQYKFIYRFVDILLNIYNKKTQFEK